MPAPYRISITVSWFAWKPGLRSKSAQGWRWRRDREEEKPNKPRVGLEKATQKAVYSPSFTVNSFQDVSVNLYQDNTWDLLRNSYRVTALFPFPDLCIIMAGPDDAPSVHRTPGKVSCGFDGLDYKICNLLAASHLWLARPSMEEIQRCSISIRCTWYLRFQRSC